jgi:hypothetical protein
MDALKETTFLGLIGRFIVINVIPFVMVFHLVMRRRQKQNKNSFSELLLVSGEMQVVGLLGYYVILSIYFFSIPVMIYGNKYCGYNIGLVEPDGYTVFLIAFISYALVVCSVYLRNKRMWAYRLSIFILSLLLLQSFFSILDIGEVCVVPVVLFTYLLYRLKRPSLMSELKLK